MGLKETDVHAVSDTEQTFDVHACELGFLIEKFGSLILILTKTHTFRHHAHIFTSHWGVFSYWDNTVKL